MTDYGYPEPAFLLEGSELPGEPVRLLLANPAVLVVGPVAAGQCRVQRGDRHAQVRHLEQRPGLRALEDSAVETLVELMEQAGVVPPLGPVRRLRLHVVGLAAGEVRTAGGPGDVVQAGNDHQVLRLQAEERAEPGEELQGLLALPQAAGFHQVAGDHHEVGPGQAGRRAPGHVGPDPFLQPGGGHPVTRAVRPGPEPGPGHLKQGDRGARAGGGLQRRRVGRRGGR